MADDSFQVMKAASARIVAGAATGTGYLVDPNRVITCEHVVKAVGEGGTVEVMFPGLSMQATVAECDAASDCAVLNLNKAVKQIMPLKLAGSVARKAAWDGYGFPGASEGTGVPLNGAIMDPNSTDDLKTSVLLLKSDQIAAAGGAPLHGFSGSPVLVEGFVVGHLKRYIQDPESPLRPAYGYVYATPSADVLKLLKMNPTQAVVEPPLPYSPAGELEHVEGPPYDVFISYSGPDRAWATALFNRLEGVGFKVFIDQRGLLPGEPLANSLQTALSRSKSAVVLISKNWLESNWCQEEGNILLNQTVKDPSFRVIPVRLDGCTWPPMWDSRIWVDFAGTTIPEGPQLLRLQYALLGQTPPAGNPAEDRVFIYETGATDELFVEIKAAIKCTEKLSVHVNSTPDPTEEMLRKLKAATAASTNRVFELWQKWSAARMPDGPANLAVAQTLIELGEAHRALEVLAHAKVGDRAIQLKALALAKVDRLDESIELLQGLYDSSRPETDAETGGILAGRYKQRWLRSGRTNTADLITSHEIYLETFERTKASYPGINAAAMALARGNRAESMRIVYKVLPALEAVELSKLDHWGLATLGEAYLLLGDLETARKWYGKAIAHARARHQDIAVMRRQARLNLENLGLRSDALDDVLYIPRVAAFSGHMVDAPGRQTPRFPADKVPAVRKAIVERLRHYGIGYGFSSAARGSDLLFVEELKKIGASVHVLLPFPRSDFKKTSVGDTWSDQFEKDLDGVDVIELAAELPAEDKQPKAYDACNKTIFEKALQKAHLLDQEPILITVWNGNPGDGVGGTADAVRAWQDAGHPVDIIDISKL